MENKTTAVVEKKYLYSFVVITCLFALWGFANDITNPMVAAFQTILEVSNAKASLVQFAFYGGYATMAIPAALFIRKCGYKSGVLLGLGLYAIGALLFIPAAAYENFYFFLGSLYILTFGLAFLETTANPYILAMGSPETATRRLNFAQSFNPMGSLCGMFIASNVILNSLSSDKRDAAGNLLYTTMDVAEKAAIRTHDLAVIRNPYVAIGLVVLAFFFIILFSKMPTFNKANKAVKVSESFKRLLANKKYREGVIAQVFYVAVQIMCWTYIIQYAENIGLTKMEAQHHNIIAMVCFLSTRFIGTYLMKYFKTNQILLVFALAGMCTISGVILIGGHIGLYLLMATSLFMSIMFPTIYGIALEGQTDDDATLGAAGLVMAIVGGAVMPPLQGTIMDIGGTGMADTMILGFIPEVNFSFILPFFCFIIIAIYAYRVGQFNKQNN